MFCNVCSGSDPTQDTVKVVMADNFSEDKENVSMQNNVNAPNTMKEKQMEAALLKAVAEENERWEEQEKRRQAEAKAEAVRLEEQKRLEEERRLEEEEEQRLADEQQRFAAEILLEHQRQAEEKQRNAAEAAKLHFEAEAKAADEERRRRQDEAVRAYTEKMQQEAADAAKLAAFLKEHGYAGVNIKRSNKMFKSKYALHSAVKHNNVDMVRILCAAGADPALKGSSGQTALQLAQKLDKKGSHSDVQRALHTEQ